MWFGYYPEIIFCHFFCNLNLVIFKCTIMAGDINSLNLLVYQVVWSILLVLAFKKTCFRLYRWIQEWKISRKFLGLPETRLLQGDLYVG